MRILYRLPVMLSNKKANRQNCPIAKTMNRTCLLAPMLSHYPIMLKFLFARSGEQM